MTIYRTDCGCIASRPEPSPAEYDDTRDYEIAWSSWSDDWQREAANHTQQCPRSAYGPADDDPTYPRCLICGAEPAPILADRREDYNRFGRHVGACYCRQHVPAGVPTVEIIEGVS